MLATKMQEYEDGLLNEREIVELFAELIKGGQAWILQGSYGRTAKAMIDEGIISSKGKILVSDEYLEDV